MVYDVTNRSSFEALSGWLKEMRTHVDSPSDMDAVVFVVCANKVSTEDSIKTSSVCDFLVFPSDRFGTTES